MGTGPLCYPILTLSVRRVNYTSRRLFTKIFTGYLLILLPLRFIMRMRAYFHDLPLSLGQSRESSFGLLYTVNSRIHKYVFGNWFRRREDETSTEIRAQVRVGRFRLVPCSKFQPVPAGAQAHSLRNGDRDETHKRVVTPRGADRQGRK